MSLQLEQLRCRPAMQGPIDARLGTMAGSTQKSGKAHRRFAEQRRDPVRPPVFHVASPATGSAIRTKLPMLVGLTGNDCSLKARQKLLRLGQAQAQVRDLPKTFRPADLHQVSAPRAGIIACLNQPQHPPHPSSSSRSPTRLVVPILSASPQSLDTPYRDSGRGGGTSLWRSTDSALLRARTAASGHPDEHTCSKGRPDAHTTPAVPVRIISPAIVPSISRGPALLQRGLPE